MSPANTDSFKSFFPVCMPFTFSSCLLGAFNTSNTMLNESDESGHSCLVSDLKKTKTKTTTQKTLLDFTH